nr:DUF1566 domain-containing protein [Rikenellaceae bacterium]
MKKLFTYFIIATVMFLAGCGGDSYDDSALVNRVDNLENRVAKLEELCRQMNTNIMAIQTIVSALQNNDYVTGVAPITQNGGVIGYTITFAKSPSITIYHGKDGKDGADGKDGQNGQDGEDGKDGQDGKDGYTPVIGVKQDTDGIYYWTLDGEWLTDEQGNKIKAEGSDGKDGANGEDGKDGADGEDGQDGANGNNGQNGQDGKDGKDGKDGITPQLKIENDYWYISYDNGISWKQLGKAIGATGATGAKGEKGDSFFLDVSQDDEYVHLTLANGTLISIPRQRPFSINFSSTGTLSFDASETMSIDYTLSYGYDNTEVRIIGDGGWEASITRKSNTTGTVTIIAPTVDSDAEIVVFATDGIGHSTMATLMCSVTNSGNLLTVINEVIHVTEAATQVEVDVQTNIDAYDVVIPTTAQSWITLADITSRAALRNDVIKLNISENTTSIERMAAVGFVNTELGITESVLIKQQRNVASQSITYTSSDGNIVTPYNEYAFGGANIVSNTYKEGVGKLVFDADVTTIGFNAFNNCTKLTSIHIPDTATSVEDYAFAGCTALAELNLGVGVQQIGALALQGCTAIKTLKIPNSITSIASGAFSGCKFTTVVLGDGLTAISSELFSGMTSLQSVLFGKNLKTIESKAFYNCSSLRLSTLPVGLTTIGTMAFSGCNAITQLTLPEGLTDLRNDAFASCTGLTNVTLPSSIATIEANAFAKCSKLAVVKCSAKTPPALGNNAFYQNAKARVIYVPQTVVKAYHTDSNWKAYKTYIVYEGSAPLKVGDLTTHGGATGVVFYVSDPLVKLVSVTETETTWSSGLTWCSNYGTGWYLPNRDELKALYQVKSTVNATLQAHEYSLIKNGGYWSSEEYSNDRAWHVGMTNGITDYYNKYGDYYVRAVSAF